MKKQGNITPPLFNNSIIMDTNDSDVGKIPKNSKERL
jgi:hypothetical protein